MARTVVQLRQAVFIKVDDSSLYNSSGLSVTQSNQKAILPVFRVFALKQSLSKWLSPWTTVQRTISSQQYRHDALYLEALTPVSIGQKRNSVTQLSRKRFLPSSKSPLVSNKRIIRDRVFIPSVLWLC